MTDRQEVKVKCLDMALRLFLATDAVNPEGYKAAGMIPQEVISHYADAFEDHVFSE
jgi:hypothetical protein